MRRILTSWHSIATRLLWWFLVVALVPLLMVTLLTYTVSNQAIRENVFQHLRNLTEEKASRIESYARQQEQQASLLAKMPHIIDLLRPLSDIVENQGIHSREYRAMAYRARPMLADMAYQLQYDELLLLNPNGQVLFALADPAYLQIDLDSDEYRTTELAKVVERAQLLLQTEVSDFEYFGDMSEPAAFIAAPVIDRGVLIGILVVQMRNTELYNVINDVRGLESTGETVVAMLRDDEVIFVAPTRHDPDAAFDRRISVGDDTMAELQQSADGIHGSGLVVDYRGEETVAAWRYIPWFRWGMMVKMDASEAFAPIIRYEQMLIVLIAVTLIVIINSAVMTAQSLFKPILQLTEGVRRMAAGDLKQQVPVVGRDEISELSAAFNTMSADLSTMYETIEEQVRQRTRELEQSNQQLDRARVAAETANRTKSTFLANMSHELRTPLNAIIGYSEMLREEAEETGHDHFVSDLKKIETAGSHLLSLINDILDLSKIEAGKMQTHLETFSITEMLEGVVTTVQPLVEKRNNSLQLICENDLGKMHADLTKVRQVLFNLLNNAAKFTEHGVVTLAVTRVATQHTDHELVAMPLERMRDDGKSDTSTDEHEWIMFQVADTGIGMSPEHIQRLFQPFTQADETTTRKYGGTGLGLTISRHFCEMMGGTITVESCLGEGTTFTIYLPAHVTLRQSSYEYMNVYGHMVVRPNEEQLSSMLFAGHEHRYVPQQQSPIARILVIDDDLSSRELIARTLLHEGYEVYTARGGAEGLHLAKRLQPDMITLDVMMPNMDGWAVLTQLKADSHLANIPVIMVTILDNRDMGFTLGAAEYLTKPIDRRRLVSLLDTYQQEPSTIQQTILVAEDDAPTRELVRRTLEKEGFRVVEAEDGEAALAYLTQCQHDANAELPSLILLDLMMPKMDGFQVIGALRERTMWQNIPVIVVTAKELTHEERRYLNGLVKQTLQKMAYSRDDLLHQVRTLVQTRLVR